MEPWYCTREEVKASPDYKHTARNNSQIDQKISAGARSMEGYLLRRYYPELRTVTWAYPRKDSSPANQLWLGPNELISLTSLTAGGVAISANDYTLKRWDEREEPPYQYIELDDTAGFADPVVAIGLFGYRNDETQVGTLSAALVGTLTATASVAWTTPNIGVGSILRIDNERMFVTERSWVDSTQNVGVALTARADNVTVAVTNGTAFSIDEFILIDSERMRIVEIAGNNLTVKRQEDGTVLAAHALNADIYTQTGVQLERAKLGTTLAAHLQDAPIYLFGAPSLVRDLNIAEAIVGMEQAQSAYARVIGGGERPQREVRHQGLQDLRKQVMAAYGRTQRSAAI